MSIIICNLILITGLLFSPFIVPSTSLASSILITQCSVDNIHIGDNTEKINNALNSIFTIRTTQRDSLTEIEALKNEKLILHVSIKDDKAFLITVYGFYSTNKKIHPGSSLADVLLAYGKGIINPTDRGYFVFFEGYPGIQFLIDNHDIPNKLRNIPDDVLTEDEERQILSLKEAKILAIQVTCY